MTSILIPASELPKLDTVLPISKGGTGSPTATGAVKNLGGISLSSIGAIGGLCPLTASGYIDPNYFPPLENSGVTLKGYSVLVVGNVGLYTITNYDSFTTYSVSASSGTVTISGDVISYTAPNVTGTFGFTVNGQTVNISVIYPSVVKPYIINPVGGTDSLGYNIQITTSNFSVASGADTHVATDWHVSKNSDFSTYVVKSEGDTNNLTVLGLRKLQNSTTYYVRVRHKGSLYGYSVWSDVSTFTIGATYLPNTEEAVVAPVGTTSGNTSIYQIGIATDDVSTRFAVGYPYMSPSGATSAGSVHIFARNGSSWNQEAIVSQPTPGSGANFGYSVSFGNAGTYLLTGARLADTSGLNASGAAHVHTRSGTTWTSQATLTAATVIANDNFGSCVKITPDTTRAAITSLTRTLSGTVVGAVEIKSRSGSAWSHETTLQPTVAVANMNYGWVLGFDQTGTKLVVGAPNDDLGVYSTAGSVYTYTRVGTVWTARTKLNAHDYRGAGFFGYSVSMTFDGTRLMVGSPGFPTTTSQNNGCVYFFTWDTTNSVWVYESKIASPIDGVNMNFGYVVQISKDGTRAAASLHGNDVQGITNAGSLVTMVRSNTSGWVIDNIISGSNKAENDEFSRAFAMADSGTRIISSASSYTTITNYPVGEIYILK